MRPHEAKKLKAGQRVIFDRPGGRAEGTVTRKRYNTVWINWDGGDEQTHRAEYMEQIFTQEQLDAMAQEQAVVRKIDQDRAADKLSRMFRW